MNFEFCLTRLPFIKVTTSVTHASIYRLGGFLEKLLMQSYPARALGRRLQVDWARDPRVGPRVLMSLRVDFEPMG